ncbi:uncharacterized protein A1O5_03459 [Cladophialophora psammophila CBS 110553]|uniref:DUF7791 domain-containing protein n=1 Tax=Cladophialophora psammophila CBS 110553 TaxID=1182543 RepID=W9WZQ0_9EURO|nr:uncharacterized protein A1O5_03459 [Cladophialophora psammophila CBS 110553]EXJ73697.1 hypothetical protein A1O5_03459 [Cladophialophora psammophila CBS 110553]
MSEGMLAIAEQALKTTAESGGIRDDIVKLSSSLSSLQIDDTTISLAVEETLKRSEINLTDKIKGLSKHLERLDDELKAISDDVHQLLPTLKREIAARRSIVESLWYSKINHRRNIIGRAHDSTYERIFRRKEDEVAVWDDFIEWLHASRRPIHWVSGKPEVEMIEVLSRVVRHLGTSKRVLLFIDGLDEHDGSDDQRQEVLELLHTLTKVENVKACVASRPYNIFRDEFHDCPQLRLEDLTKDDIRLYAQSKLSENPHFWRQQKREPQLLQKITEEITRRARGVFLWHLFRELENIPLDLDEYFRRIFESIERPYRKEASIILQTALYSIGSEIARTCLPGNSLGFEFLLIHLHFLERSEDLYFAANQGLYDVDFECPQESREFLESLERMLASRSMGLLETDSGTDYHPHPFYGTKLRPGMRIEFLHRTVRDYFAGRAARDLLHQHTGGPFDAHMFQCNLMVTNMRTFALPYQLLSYDLTSMTPFLHQILVRPELPGGEEAAFILFETMVELLNEPGCTLRHGVQYDTALWLSLPVAKTALENWADDYSNALSLGIQIGWRSYVKARLTATIQEKEGRPLLDYALRSCHNMIWIPPHHDILHSLLILGPGPDAFIHGDYNVPIWAYFLESPQFMTSLDYAACPEVVRTLMMHGIRTMVTVAGESHVPETLYSFLDVLPSLWFYDETPPYDVFKRHPRCLC